VIDVRVGSSPSVGLNVTGLVVFGGEARGASSVDDRIASRSGYRMPRVDRAARGPI
jgi:hypothetical protein